MLIKSDFEVAQGIDKVWAFFDDIPQVAACLPGAELTDQLVDDDGAEKYNGKVGIRMGPVKLQFAGTAKIVERDNAARKVVVDAAGADEKGRGQASMLVTATLAPTARGTKVDVIQDLQLSGAAAQYGRGMISDVTAVLMRDFATNMQLRIEAADKGLSLDSLGRATPASGLAIGLQALRMALMRVFRRFFLPYQPNPS
jgi:carbon monoxide dehydrogenase subunit G